MDENEHDVCVQWWHCCPVEPWSGRPAGLHRYGSAYLFLWGARGSEGSVCSVGRRRGRRSRAGSPPHPQTPQGNQNTYKHTTMVWLYIHKNDIITITISRSHFSSVQFDIFQSTIEMKILSFLLSSPLRASVRLSREPQPEAFNYWQKPQACGRLFPEMERNLRRL